MGTTNYPTLPIDFFSPDEQTKIRSLVEKLIDPKDFDFTQVLTVTSQTQMVIDGLLSPKVYLTGKGLALKVGNNFIDLVFDSKKNQWFSLSGTPLMLGNRQDETTKIDYPIFQLDLGSELYSFPIAWQTADVLAPVKTKLRGLLIPPSADLKKYVKQFAVIPAPLYALVQAGTAKLSDQGMAHYRIVDVDYATGKYPGYTIAIDPSHVPQVPLYDLNGRTFSGNIFNAQNASKEIIDANFDALKDRCAKWWEAFKALNSTSPGEEAGLKAIAEAQKLETWLIIQGVIKLDNGKLSVKHTIFQGALPAAIKEFRPTLDPKYKILPVTVAPQQIEATPNYDNNPL